MAVAPEASRAATLPAASTTAEELFQEHSGWLYGYCLRVLRSPEDAEDAVQTTYLNAYRSLQEGTRPRVGSAWLLHIARNVCFARARSLGRRTKVERVQDTAILEETAVAPDRFADELIGLTEALERLPARQREAILLREWQGLSYSEVADRLDVTQSAVETLIFRARRSLAQELEDPGKPRRRRALYSLDLGGLAAALKGFFAGGGGVKTVAALSVAAATTTVVATDPSGILRDRQERPVPPAVVEQGAGAADDVAGAEAAGRAGRVAAPLTGLAPPAVRVSTPGTAGTPQTDGKAKKAKKTPPGKAEETPAGAPGANGKSQAKGPGGNGKGKALGLAKQDSAPKASKEQPRRTGKPDSPPGQSTAGPEPKGKATGQTDKRDQAAKADKTHQS
jgi:RNA polymerase sigma-70 factor (ECF subfamily)